jgi:invasion protein IalB
MTPLQDMILVAAAAVGVVLIAARSSPTVIAQQQRPPASVRELCEDDMAKFCADAAGPQKMKACVQGNAKQLKPACRSALESAGMLPK